MSFEKCCNFYQDNNRIYFSQCQSVFSGTFIVNILIVPWLKCFFHFQKRYSEKYLDISFLPSISNVLYFYNCWLIPISTFHFFPPFPMTFIFIIVYNYYRKGLIPKISYEDLMKPELQLFEFIILFFLEDSSSLCDSAYFLLSR